jgi:hypothetical protein
MIIEEKVYNSVLEIRHEWTPCFFSASWMIRMFVNSKIYIESEGKDSEWAREDIENWVRSKLLVNWSELSSMGINVNKEYEKWGGKLF